MVVSITIYIVCMAIGSIPHQKSDDETYKESKGLLLILFLVKGVKQ